MKRGFTLVEMLVVILIIGILAAILIPAINYARESARRTACNNRIRQIATAIIAFDTRKRELPPLHARETGVNSATGATWAFQYNWPVYILPDMGRDDLWSRISDPMFNPTNTAISGPAFRYMADWHCPSNPPDDRTIPTLGYILNAGRKNYVNSTTDGYAATVPNPFQHDWPENGVFDDLAAAGLPGAYVHRKRSRLSKIATLDGASNTLMVAETSERGLAWPTAATEYQAGFLWFPFADSITNAEGPMGADAMEDIANYWIPGSNPSDPCDDHAEPLGRYKNDDLCGDSIALIHQYGNARPISRHNHGFNVAFCDGSVLFMRDNLPYSIYARLMTSDGTNAKQPGLAGASPYPTWQQDKIGSGDKTKTYDFR